MSATAVPDLLELARSVGGDVLQIQGAGGNVSVKARDGASMWVKSSGVRLAEMSTGRGYVELDRPGVISVVRDPAIHGRGRREAHEEAVVRLQATLRSGSARPSMETGFHAVLPDRLVLHTHPIYVNAFSCWSEGAEALLRELSDDCPAWVAYAAPGQELSERIDEVQRELAARPGQATVAIVLANHGLICAGDTPKDVLARSSALCELGRRFFGSCEAELDRTEPVASAWIEELGRAYAARTGRAAIVRAPSWRALEGSGQAWEERFGDWPLMPDSVVYCGGAIPTIDGPLAADAWLASIPLPLPERMVVIRQDRGVVFLGANETTIQAMEDNLLAHVLVRTLIRRRGSPRVLPAAEVDYLLSMESEKYRQKLAASPPARAGA